MASRTTRIVLDMALVSLEKVRPVVAKAWGNTKCYVQETRAKPLLCNRFVNRLEIALDKLTGSLSLKLRSLRNKQLPAEVEYLQKELEKVKKKLHEEKGLKSAAKNVKYFGATAWRYIKVEAVPPFTGSFFSGPVFQKVEAFVGTVADSFIGSLAGRIQEIDVEAEQVRLERLAAIKALEEKIKADAKRSREEAMKKAAALAAEEAKKIKIEAAKKRTVEITKAQKEDQKEKKEKKEKPKQKEPKGRKRKKPKPKPKPKV